MSIKHLPSLICPACRLTLSEDLACKDCGFKIIQRNEKIFDCRHKATESLDAQESPWNHLENREVILRRLRAFNCPLAISENYVLDYLKKLEIDKGNILLEIGVYSSAILHYFSITRGTSGIGIDISLDALEKQAELSDILGTNNNYFLGDCSLLPFADESFDCIICLDLLEHLPKRNQEIFLEECHRVLKETGKIVIKIPLEKEKGFSFESLLNKNALKKTRESLGHAFEDAVTLTEFKGMLKVSGFEILFSSHIGFLLDYIYDNYILWLKDRAIQSIINRSFTDRIQGREVFYKNLTHVLLRYLYYAARIITLSDLLSCKLGYGINFICLAEKEGPR